MRVAFNDRLKYLLSDPGNDSFEFGRVDICSLEDNVSLACFRIYIFAYHHREGLSTTSLTVGEHSAIVAIEDI